MCQSIISNVSFGLEVFDTTTAKLNYVVSFVSARLATNFGTRAFTGRNDDEAQ